MSMYRSPSDSNMPVGNAIGDTSPRVMHQRRVAYVSTDILPATVEITKSYF